MYNNVTLVKELLLSRGVDVNGFDNAWQTALDYAVKEGSVECVKLLLEANADVNKTHKYGSAWTPLHQASDSGFVECVKILIDWKADVNAKTKDGLSPLHWAALSGDVVCMEVQRNPFYNTLRLTINQILVQAGALQELDARDDYGNTPLALSIFHNKPDAAELLLDKGAKISNVTDKVEIPDWVNLLQEKRRRVIHSYNVFYGVLRRRCKIGKDMTQKVSTILWSTRFNEEWL